MFESRRGHSAKSARYVGPRGVALGAGRRFPASFPTGRRSPPCPWGHMGGGNEDPAGSVGAPLSAEPIPTPHRGARANPVLLAALDLRYGDLLAPSDPHRLEASVAEERASSVVFSSTRGRRAACASREAVRRALLPSGRDTPAPSPAVRRRAGRCLPRTRFDGSQAANLRTRRGEGRPSSSFTVRVASAAVECSVVVKTSLRSSPCVARLPYLLGWLVPSGSRLASCWSGPGALWGDAQACRRRSVVGRLRPSDARIPHTSVSHDDAQSRRPRRSAPDTSHRTTGPRPNCT